MRVCKVLSCTLLFLLVSSLTVSAARPAWPTVDAPHYIPLPAGSLPAYPQDAQSTTGPTRPTWVRDVGALDAADQGSLSAVTISGVPAYLWRHGCGPTALGMALGYWDGRGFDNLVPGNTFTQTEAVQQAIASDGPASNYTDYGEPMDAGTPTILPDKSEDPPGDEHADNSVADYMRTSQSHAGNRYGWSYFSDIGQAFQAYVLSASQGKYTPSVTNLWMRSSPLLTWEAFRAEIDAGRPMVLLVDTSSDGVTDHFVTAIGYDEAGGARRYACLDTWGTAVRWEAFAPIAVGQPWGIYGAALLVIEPSRLYKIYMPLQRRP